MPPQKRPLNNRSGVLDEHCKACDSANLAHRPPKPTGSELIAQERQRQIEKGFDASHDDAHGKGEIADIAEDILHAAQAGSIQVTHAQQIDEALKRVIESAKAFDAFEGHKPKEMHDIDYSMQLITLRDELEAAIIALSAPAEEHPQ